MEQTSHRAGEAVPGLFRLGNRRFGSSPWARPTCSSVCAPRGYAANGRLTPGYGRWPAPRAAAGEKAK